MGDADILTGTEVCASSDKIMECGVTHESCGVCGMFLNIIIFIYKLKTSLE